MRQWSVEQVARAAGAVIVSPPAAGGGPLRAAVDTRELQPGDLFIGIAGAHSDGGAFAHVALEARAWGALTTPLHAHAAAAHEPAAAGALLAADDPARALARLATAWRRELAADVIAVTGSTGKTSTKDILAALLRGARRAHWSDANYNTEIGLPLSILAAPPGTQAIALELAMRGPNQIAELTAIAEPDVGLIVNVGPVHVELLGSLAAVVAAKAELIRDLRPGATAVVPVAEPLLEPHLRADLRTVRFGAGGDVELVALDGYNATIAIHGERVQVALSFRQAHQIDNLLAAIAAADAIGVRPGTRLDVAFSALRGERVELADGTVVINDCYNANPMSMRAALDELAASASPQGRRVAVLGDMLELGPEAPAFHADLGTQASARDVDVLITVGALAANAADRFDGEQYAVADAEEAAALLPELLQPGDTVLVKGSRGVGLEVVAETLQTARA